jgi:Bacteriophage Sf6, terminase small subunit-like
MARTGRPTKYTSQLAEAICARLAEGESLRQICRDEDMPVQSTVYLWLLDADHRDFSENYAQARNIQAEVLFDEALEIADARSIRDPELHPRRQAGAPSGADLSDHRTAGPTEERPEADCAPSGVGLADRVSLRFLTRLLAN